LDNITRQFKNLSIRVRGFLGHDNKLWDRTCPNCKGMYSSYQHSMCPKCNTQLVYITTSKGKPMSVSEGTIYPAIGDAQKKADAQAVANRKNGMEPIWRFKIFSFADDNGVLAPPPEHMHLKTGAFVEIMIHNHQPIPSFFRTKDNKPMVEFMLMVYSGYGDTVKILKEKQANEVTASYPVDSQGNTKAMTWKNVPPDKADTAQLAAQVAALQNQLQALLAGGQTPPPPAQNVQPKAATTNAFTDVPGENEYPFDEGALGDLYGDDSFDPF
jgi:hypothetical protein